MKRISVAAGAVFPKSEGLSPETFSLLGLDDSLDRKLDYSNDLGRVCESLSKLNLENHFMRNDNGFLAIVPLLPAVYCGSEPEYLEARFIVNQKLGIKLDYMTIDHYVIPSEVDVPSSCFYVNLVTDPSLYHYKHYFVDLKSGRSSSPNLVSINKYTNHLGMPGIESDDSFFKIESREYRCELNHLIKNKIWVYSIKYSSSDGRVTVSRHRYTYISHLRQILEISEKIVDMVFYVHGNHTRGLRKELSFLRGPIKRTKEMFECLISEYHEFSKAKKDKLCHACLPESFSLKNSSMGG